MVSYDLVSFLVDIINHKSEFQSRKDLSNQFVNNDLNLKIILKNVLLIQCLVNIFFLQSNVYCMNSMKISKFFWKRA